MGLNISNSRFQSSLISNTLKLFFEELEDDFHQSKFSSNQELLLKSHKIIKKTLDQLISPFFSPILVRTGEIPNLKDYNEMYSLMTKDILLLFKEINSLNSFIVDNFNYLQRQLDQLLGKIKEVDALIFSIQLYGEDPFSGGLNISDSFNSQQTLQTSHSATLGNLCNVDFEEGVVTLPINRSRRVESRDPIIRLGSNGNPSEKHKRVQDVLDGNPDTWFEYEKVLSSNDQSADPLILDITIPLKNLEIINKISIFPNNLGVRVPVTVKELEVSSDGSTWISLIDSPVEISPASSKFSGKFIFSFLPKQARFIHCYFTQSHAISTFGKKRYAIAIRDIDIFSISYSGQGSLVSKEYRFGENISRVAMEVSQIPGKQSDFLDIKYQLSFDGGNTWNDLSPNNFNFPRYSKILSTLTDSLLFRILFERKSIPNNIDNPLLDEATSTYSVERFPLEGKFYILKETPSGPIQLTLSGLGARTLRYDLPSLVYKRNPSSTAFDLSLKGTPFSIPDIFKKEEMRIRIGSDYSEPNLDMQSRVVEGLAGDIEELELSLLPEKVFPTRDKRIMLKFATPREKSAVRIYSIDSQKTLARINLKNSSREFNLGYTDIDESSFNILHDSTNVFSTKKNSYAALSIDGDYYLDAQRGRLYSYKATDSISSYQVSFLHYPVRLLRDTDWDFVSNEGSIGTTIQIKNTGWISTPKSPSLISLSPGDSFLALEPNGGIAPNSLKIDQISPGSPNHFQEEVLSPILANFSKQISGGADEDFSPNYYFNLDKFSTSSEVLSFSPSAEYINFINSSASNDLSTDWNWLVADGKFKIKLPSIIDSSDNFGTLFYTIDSPITDGQYYVDYENGNVHFPALSGNTSISVTYQVTNYYVEYLISEKLNQGEHFQLNGKTIALDESLDLERFSGSQELQASYLVPDKEVLLNLPKLAEYSSPILKHLVIKAITERGSLKRNV